MSIRDMSFSLSIPPFFKEIFLHLPHALLDLISWKEMISEVTVLSNRQITGKGADAAYEGLVGNLDERVTLAKELMPTVLNPKEGELILKIYFDQIMNCDIMMLDLRTKHFAANDTGLSWSPGKLWASFDPEFREGIRKIYHGYYFYNDQEFAEGLTQCKLIKAEWTQSQKDEVIDVFKTHFGSAREGNVVFSLDHFKKSFGNIFTTLLKNKIRLDKNFLYLGIMLVTLYISLDAIGGAYNVSNIFKQEE